MKIVILQSKAEEKAQQEQDERSTSSTDWTRVGRDKKHGATTKTSLCQSTLLPRHKWTKKSKK